VFRRDLSGGGGGGGSASGGHEAIYRQLPANIYPEYHAVHRLMLVPDQDQSEGYRAYPEHEVVEFTSSREVRPCLNLSSPLGYIFALS